MKISRVIDSVPYEFGLTPQEKHELYAEMYLKHIKDNILYLIGQYIEVEDPDNRMHEIASAMKANLQSSPIFFDRVAKQYDDLREEAIDMEEDFDIVMDAYKYMLKCWEVKSVESD